MFSNLVLASPSFAASVPIFTLGPFFIFFSRPWLQIRARLHPSTSLVGDVAGTLAVTRSLKANFHI